jgi:hypothetical protein
MSTKSTSLSLSLSLFTSIALAVPLAACASDPAPDVGVDESEIANQEIFYTYYDCQDLDSTVGWRLRGCFAGNVWAYEGVRSQCYEVSSDDCSNPAPVITYCELGTCASYDPFDSIPTFYEWATSN